MDLIERKKAIDEIMKELKDRSLHDDEETSEDFADGYDEGVRNAATRVYLMPSAQPEKRTETHACDLISRQDALDALEKIGWIDTKADKEYAIRFFTELPSVQPEIVHCKDCEYCVPGYITDNDDFIPPRCGRLRQTVRISGDDYCSFAERRTDE